MIKRFGGVPGWSRGVPIGNLTIKTESWLLTQQPGRGQPAYARMPLLARLVHVSAAARDYIRFAPSRTGFPIRLPRGNGQGDFFYGRERIHMGTITQTSRFVSLPLFCGTSTSVSAAFTLQAGKSRLGSGHEDLGTDNGDIPIVDHIALQGRNCWPPTNRRQTVRGGYRYRLPMA